jgi:hypothetical protein
VNNYKFWSYSGIWIEGIDKRHKETSDRTTDNSYEIQIWCILYALTKAAQKSNKCVTLTMSKNVAKSKGYRRMDTVIKQTKILSTYNVN